MILAFRDLKIASMALTVLNDTEFGVKRTTDPIYTSASHNRCGGISRTYHTEHADSGSIRVYCLSLHGTSLDMLTIAPVEVLDASQEDERAGDKSTGSKSTTGQFSLCFTDGHTYYSGRKTKKET